MIHINRSQPAPVALAEEKQKDNGTYNLDEVLRRLCDDFYGRCYLCESTPQEIHIDHLVPHQNRNRDLEFDWDNLFLSCSRCNNIKGQRDNIANCVTDPDIESKIHYEIKPSFIENCAIRALDNSITTQRTAELLNDIFNGETENKALSSNNLRSSIVKSNSDMWRAINRLFSPQLPPDVRAQEINLIKESLSPRALFASFNRHALRDQLGTYRKVKEIIPDLEL